MIYRAIITVAVDYESKEPLSQRAVERLITNVFGHVLEDADLVELSDVDPQVVTLERRLGVRVEQVSNMDMN
jgi:hypothetical protein